MKQWKKLLSLLVALSMALAGIPVLAENPQIGYVNGDAKLYMSASRKALVESSATLGTQVRIEEELLSEGEGWYRITVLENGRTGWVPADDVDLVIAKKPMAQTAPAAAPAGVSQVTDESAFPVLTASGLVDSTDYPLIQEGESNELVPAIKARLNELGFNGGPEGTVLTKEYTTLLRRFQQKNYIKPADGICSPELLKLLFSDNARNNAGSLVVYNDPIEIVKGAVIADRKGGGSISFTIRNRTGAKIDAFDYSLRLYSTYGERFLVGSVSEKATLQDELTIFQISEERITLNRNQMLQMKVDMGYYFAGVLVAVTAYHTEMGNTVRIPDDELHWFGFGKGVVKGYEERLVSSLSKIEEERAKTWDFGVGGVRVDDEIGKQYGIRGGLLINTMQPGSPADAAGLKSGDVLMAVGDVRIFGQTSLERAKAAVAAGETVTVLFCRNGSVWQTQLTRPSDAASI